MRAVAVAGQHRVLHRNLGWLLLAAPLGLYAAWIASMVVPEVVRVVVPEVVRSVAGR